jgi:hypothetical protein
MAILTTSGRVALAMSVINEPIHLAWGSGSPDWDTTPVAESISESALVSEVGRRVATSLRYCAPDVAGEIIVPNGRFAESVTPTNHLFLRFNFDFADAPNSSIREIGIFIGTTINSGLPPGQMYFIPAQLLTTGTLLALERIPKIARSAAVRQSFEFVLTI